ncbi:MetQ/NlpA family ABC transporter substrate-binding protein [Anaeropeptidivorans aminofermentans]|jgi:D-methionine transport system substrate-binding protein|uniref:MetQ/NlpA family ABC transporter substrate-binding protein n=1 Tax=Anaeropeptidivorans aminofermentans TaxID=2934315 RepID=UPI000EEE0F80|nr:MetQ/NlpA family ABC transporter substrate-binding protein [Anaeropeptidivorans aminofermentans]HAQ39380.1 methionine ABC transporter substrate-binding protein [Clostridiales bacterium]
MKKLLIAAIFMVIALTTGCQKAEKPAEEKTTIKIGTTATVVEEVEAAKNGLKEMGYDMEIVMFDDPISLNVGLLEGEIDVNFLQHRPYLENFNKEKNADLYMMEDLVHAPVFALFSEKHTSVEEIPDDAKIAVSTDPSNQSRALFMLQELGLIKLSEGIEAPTIYDVSENSKNIEFVEVDLMQLTTVLPDVDASCMAASLMIAAGKDAKSAIATSGTDDLEKFGAALTVRQEDKDAEWAKALNKAFHTDEMRESILKIFDGAFVPMF